MAFRQCNPGDKNAYGFVWICGEQHEVADPEAVKIMPLNEKVTDKGGGKFSLDKSESAYIEVAFRRLPQQEVHAYQAIRCCVVQYQDKNFLYTIPEAAFIFEEYAPGDGEKISGKFMVTNAQEISYVPV